MLTLCFLLVDGANILQFCNVADYGSGSIADDYCAAVNTFLINEGHTVTLIDSVQLTSADFVGIDVLWDCTTELNSNTPACGATWGGTTEPAVTAFLASGGSAIFTGENSSFLDCNNFVRPYPLTPPLPVTDARRNSP